MVDIPKILPLEKRPFKKGQEGLALRAVVYKQTQKIRRTLR